MKQKIFLVIRAAISGGLVAALIYMVRDSIPDMIVAVKRLPISIVFFGFILFVLSALIASFRLKILLAAQSIFLSLIDITKLTFVGYFFSSFLPTSVGGDIVKAFYISKASNKTMLSYTTVFIDRFLGMSTLFLLATCTLFYIKEIPKSHFNWSMPLLLLASGLFLVFLFNRRFAKIFTFFLTPFVPANIREKFKVIYNAIHSFKEYKPVLLESLLISIVGQTIAFVAIYFFALGLNSYIPVKFVLLTMPVASIVSMLPSIYGVGPREMSIVVFLGPLIGKDKALAIAFLWLCLLLTTALVGGIIYMFMGHYKIEALSNRLSRKLFQPNDYSDF